MGARLTLTEGHAPLTIEGALLRAIDYTTPVPAPRSRPVSAGRPANRRHHHRARVPAHPRPQRAGLRAFGATLTRDLDSVSIAGPQALHAIEAQVPATFSSAAFFLAAAAIFPGSTLLSTRSAQPHSRHAA